jgi:YD repeat-containing protein
VFPLRFVRHYNSAWAEERGLGAHWRTHYDRELAASATRVVITRPEGQAFVFNLSGEVWTAEADVIEHLERLTEAGVFTGWRYTTAEDEVEVYDTQGRLVSIADHAGVSQILVYDGQGRLSTVIHTPSGRTLRLTYDALHRLRTLTDPAGGVYRYVYDARGLELARTEGAGTPEKQTLTTEWHPEFRLPTRLTKPGRVSEFSYDSAGRLLSKTETDPASGAFRTWTYTYTAQGLLAPVDGPRMEGPDRTPTPTRRRATSPPSPTRWARSRKSLLMMRTGGRSPSKTPMARSPNCATMRAGGSSAKASTAV